MLTHGSGERGRKEKKNACLHSLNLSVCFGEERSNFKLFLVGILDIAGYDHTETENGLEGCGREKILLEVYSKVQG